MNLLRKVALLSILLLSVIGSTRASDQLAKEDFETFRDRGLYKFLNEYRSEIASKLGCEKEIKKRKAIFAIRQPIIDDSINQYKLLRLPPQGYSTFYDICNSIYTLYSNLKTINRDNYTEDSLCNNVLSAWLMTCFDADEYNPLYDGHSASIHMSKYDHHGDLCNKIEENVIASMEMYSDFYGHSHPRWEELKQIINADQSQIEDIIIEQEIKIEQTEEALRTEEQRSSSHHKAQSLARKLVFTEKKYMLEDDMLEDAVNQYNILTKPNLTYSELADVCLTLNPFYNDRVKINKEKNKEYLGCIKEISVGSWIDIYLPHWLVLSKLFSSKTSTPEINPEDKLGLERYVVVLLAVLEKDLLERMEIYKMLRGETHSQWEKFSETKDIWYSWSQNKDIPQRALTDIKESRLYYNDNSALFTFKNKENYEEAMKWYSEAAEQKNAAAQYNLGTLLEKENFPSEAIKWYNRAAEQKNAAAQYTLGCKYLHGIEVKENHKEAFKWFNEVPTMITSHMFSSRRSNPLTDEIAPELASLLSKTQHLTIISLANNRFTSQGLVHILNALQSHPTLVTLDLNNNNIDGKGGNALLTFLKEKSSLKIDVSDNPMCEEIKKSIKRMNSLRISPLNIKLDTFSSCDFTDEDASQVAFILSQATHLDKVILSGNKFTSKGLTPLLNTLKSLPNLLGLDLEDNDIDDEGGNALLTFAKEKRAFSKKFNVYVKNTPMSEVIKRLIEIDNKNECSIL